MMSGQPTRDQIVRKFMWCQWEAVSQRLYYIHNVRQGSSQAESVGHKLSAIQFHSGGRFDNMVSGSECVWWGEEGEGGWRWERKV